MRINFNRLLVILTLIFSTSLFSSTVEEAKRNLDLGYYIISEYLYLDLVDSGNTTDDVLVGISISLVNQAKYQEIIALSEEYSRDNMIYNRNIAYAFFMKKDYQASFYYYDKAINEDNTSLLDISGRGWSSYYLGKFSLAYEDFKVIDNSEYRDSFYDGMKFLNDHWKNNYCGAFVSFNDNKVNLNLNYSLNRYNYSFSVNYNQNRGEDSKREMIILQSNIKTGKFSFDFSSMNAQGDYTKLYDGYGLALKSSYLLMFKEFQSNISLIGGYAYFESVSSQQVRADIRFNNQRFGISSGISYLYLDYITPNYDQQEILYHGSVYFKIIPAITIDYRLNLGKSNFAYNEYLIPYDDYDIENLSHSVGVSGTFRSITLYLNYLNKDLEDDTIGTGVSYVF
jgi:hypothetical protein